MQEVLKRYHDVRNQVPQNIILTLVTKKQNMETILPLIELGHKHFAENYIQEAKEKWNNVSGVNLKLIGHLQSNKIKEALALFDEIHTIDRLDLALKIHKIITPQTKTKVFYAQINIGCEEQKSGIFPELFHEFFANCPLEISGIMCIPPDSLEPSPYFKQMVEIAEFIKVKFGKSLKISMGMSNDFKTAIECKSNEVRVGSAIFGARI